VKATAARQAGLERVRFAAGVKVTSEVSRGKWIAEWRVVRAEVLLGEVG
jgi:hypothetical protein